MLQIVEQILPYFAPEFNITIKMNDVHQEVDVPIIQHIQIQLSLI